MTRAAPKRLPPAWYARTRLKLRHLQLLVAMDEARNLNRAAQALGITQPAASKLLAEIERLLGGAVFDRRPRGVEPNPLGEVLVRRARAVLEELDQAGAELNSLRDGSGGRAAIGAVTAPAVGAVARAVEGVLRASPSMQVTVEVDTSGPLVARLLQGRLDFVLARIPPGAEAARLDYLEVAAEELCFLVAAGHPLLALDPVPLAATLDFGWVLEPPESLLRQEIDALFLRHGLDLPRRVLNTPSVLVGLAALMQGQSICVVTDSVARLLEASGEIRRLSPLLEQPRVTVRPYGLIRSRERPLSPAAERLYEAVMATLAL